MDDASPDESYYKEPLSRFLLDGGGPELIFEGAIHQDKYEATSINTYDIIHELLAEWFTSIWTKLSGQVFPIPVFIGAHNHDAFIDLRTGTKCSAANIWPEA